MPAIGAVMNGNRVSGLPSGARLGLGEDTPGVRIDDEDTHDQLSHTGRHTINVARTPQVARLRLGGADRESRAHLR